MTDQPLTHLHPVRDDREEEIKQRIVDQAAGLTPATVERYRVVADTLSEFLDTVDVAPRLGPEIACHLDAQRLRLGSGAFVATLGIESLVRMLPEFLDDPWLPPSGAQRRSHRVVVDRLLTFLRRELVDPGVLRPDLSRVRRAVGAARGRDYGQWTEPDADEATLTVTVTLDLRESTVDRLLDAVEAGQYCSLDEAVRQRIDTDPEAWRFPCY